jgi:hypothetical protein
MYMERVFRKWARRRGALPPVTVIGVLAFGLGYLLRDALGNLTRAAVKSTVGLFIFGDSSQLSDSLASGIGIIIFVILCCLAFFAGSIYSKWNNPELFLDRTKLDKVFRGDPLAEVETAHCVFLLAQKFLERSDSHKVKKLILPDPDSETVEYLRSTLDYSQDLRQHLRSVIAGARKKNIDVRLVSHFSGTSWWIGDRDKTDPFVHIEIIFPHMTRPDRPSFRVYRSQDVAFYERYCEVFDQLWSAAKKAGR